MAGHDRFELVRSEKEPGKFHWHLKRSNNDMIAWSGQNYVDRDECRKMIEWIRANAARIPVEDLT